VEFADFSSAFAPTTSNSGLPVSVANTAAAMPDLFGDFSSVTNAPAVGASKGGDLDLFGLLPAPVAALPAAHFPSAGPAAVSSLDLLGGLDLVGGSVPSFQATTMSAAPALSPLQPATILPAGTVLISCLLRYIPVGW